MKKTELRQLRKKYRKQGATLIVIAVIALVWLISKCSHTSLSVGANDGIDITPEQIQSIRDIGQWEFLAISDEELVDTTRRGFFSDDHLARIYYGTLRLGIDFQQTSDGWITTQGDTLCVLMPKIMLLDDNFIDEARTQSFHESGSWTGRDREILYRKAHRMMKQHCLTPKNLAAARDNGALQMRQLLRAMGFEKVRIEFEY